MQNNVRQAISLQDFCVKNEFPLTTSYRALTKFVAQYVVAQGKPAGKNDLIFDDHGFIVKNYGSKKRALYIVTDESKFRFRLALLVGYENLLSKNAIFEIFKAATKGRTDKQELVVRGLKRVGLM